MVSENERGSHRIFELEGRDDAALADAIGAGRANYDIKWWWKYGTPAIDLIRGGVHVRPEQIGETLQQFLRLNSQGVQVSAHVFPLGITNPDLFQVDLELRQSVKG